MAAKKSSAKKSAPAKKSSAKSVPAAKKSAAKAKDVRDNTSNDARGAEEAAKSNTETTTIGPPEEIESPEDAAPMNYDEDGGGVPETR